MTGKGRALKERHGTLLDDNIQVDDVYVLCRSVPRTIESVQCLLKGFFEQQKTPQVYVHSKHSRSRTPSLLDMAMRSSKDPVQVAIAETLAVLRSRPESASGQQ
ncbi:uncharacterized protein KRP23_2926 [Phytophthora ramorum]|uniref:uncharacterized protein n=1 Tax=Phytophthora ramorum TaxID=164328 RepID=UPI0030966F6A|nr:hypothetical protein KRP23_2926 [Phytophthora ramorum]